MNGKSVDAVDKLEVSRVFCGKGWSLVGGLSYMVSYFRKTVSGHGA